MLAGPMVVGGFYRRKTKPIMSPGYSDAELWALSSKALMTGAGACPSPCPKTVKFVICSGWMWTYMTVFLVPFSRSLIGIRMPKNTVSNDGVAAMVTVTG